MCDTCYYRYIQCMSQFETHMFKYCAECKQKEVDKLKEEIKERLYGGVAKGQTRET